MIQDKKSHSFSPFPSLVFSLFSSPFLSQGIRCHQNTPYYILFDDSEQHYVPTRCSILRFIHHRLSRRCSGSHPFNRCLRCSSTIDWLLKRDRVVAHTMGCGLRLRRSVKKGCHAIRVPFTTGNLCLGIWFPDMESQN